MKKIVRLTESDLVKLVKRVISEQATTTNYVDSTYLKDLVALVNNTLTLTVPGQTFFVSRGNIDATGKQNRSVLKLDFISEEAKMGLGNYLGTNWKNVQPKIVREPQSQFGTFYVFYKVQQAPAV